MKKSKIIIPALAMLVMSTAATVTGTVAWFTMNKTATAEGMVVSAKTSGSLIIKDVTSVLALPSAADKATKIVFDDTPHAFYPSTHGFSYTNPNDNDANTNENITSSTGLFYVSNGATVNFETGTARNSTTPLVYGAVVEPGANQVNAYYADYDFFLAGDGMEMNNQIITLTLSNAQNLTINGALSIDVYGKEITSAERVPVIEANYKGTLNLAKVKNGSGVGTSEANPSVVIGDPTTHTGYAIPKSGAQDPQSGDPVKKAYAIKMRVYYDGALISDPVANNFWAVYESAGTGAWDGTGDGLFYGDANGTSIVTMTTGDSLDGKYRVKTSASTLTFARSIDVANIAEQTLDVQIVASEA